MTDDSEPAVEVVDTDAEGGVAVNSKDLLAAEEFHAEAVEAFSKHLRRHCGYSADEVAGMDLTALAAAVKSEVGGE